MVFADVPAFSESPYGNSQKMGKKLKQTSFSHNNEKRKDHTLLCSTVQCSAVQQYSAG